MFEKMVQFFEHMHLKLAKPQTRKNVIKIRMEYKKISFMFLQIREMSIKNDKEKAIGKILSEFLNFGLCTLFLCFLPLL